MTLLLALDALPPDRMVTIPGGQRGAQGQLAHAGDAGRADARARPVLRADAAQRQRRGQRLAALCAGSVEGLWPG